MDLDPADSSSRERVVSSEPCSTRPIPFDEAESASRKKRRRLERQDSRSRSVDTPRDPDVLSDSPPLHEDSPSHSSPPTLPQTPTREPVSSPPPEPTSSKVTINLRTARALESPARSSSPASPSKMVNGDDGTGARQSIESESDALSTVAAMETPSASPSDVGSPTIELVPSSEDDGQSPPVAILSGDDANYADPWADLPFLEGGSLLGAAKSLQHYMQYDECANEDIFCRFCDWMENYLELHENHRVFYDSFMANQDFWNAFPHIFWALNHRSKFFGPWLHNSRQGRGALRDIFTHFAKFAGKFLAMDVRILESHAESGNLDSLPELGSPEFLKVYTFFTKRDAENSQHIGSNLEQHYSWNWEENVVAMSNGFHSSGGSLSNLTKYVERQLALMPQLPKVIDNLQEPCRLAYKIVADASKALEQAEHEDYLGTLAKHLNQGFKFFKIMSAGVESMIEKHVNCVIPAAANCYLTSLTFILRNTLVSEVEQAIPMLERCRQTHPELPRKHLPKIIAFDWKFSLLYKLITSTQMQLRVIGVTTMCTDLLNLYNAHRDNSEPPRSPVLLYFAEFVLEKKLMDYVVSIGSHPEIINESSNILGFLIVTKMYPPQLTDLIWQTVMTSQDPRVSEAILRMLKHVMNLYDYKALLHMCEKTSDLPIEAFTAPMRAFCEMLLQQFVTKSLQDGKSFMDAAPYELCTRLIRQASVITAENPNGYPDIQMFAAGQLQTLLLRGSAIDIRNSIYKSCIEDISSGSPTSGGSICVVNAFLRQNRHVDLHTLATEYGLTQLLVQELEQFVKGTAHLHFIESPVNVARRQLILMVITEEPDTISPDLGQRLWDHLVGSESTTSLAHQMSWQVLIDAYKFSPKNSFITACFRHYLPTLPPCCFSSGALEFAKADAHLWLDQVGESLNEDDSFESPAIEQIWRMILNASPSTIDPAAISFIVWIYLDTAAILCIPRDRARGIHLKLVKRCLKQLEGAASKLKSFSEGTFSGDDDGMVIVPSEAQEQEQERIFARSLAVLREFLSAYQMKPHFQPPKPKKPPLITTNDVDGESVQVAYQSFDGNSHTDIKHLTLGKQNTAATLFASLQKATGFQNYKAYFHGKRLSPDETDVCKSLEDLNIQHGHLILICRSDHVEASSPETSASTITLEAEIVKHLDELWGYLSMHEKVAQEIYHFLVKFPVYDRLLEGFESATTSCADIFPQGQPYKSLYAVHALRQRIAGKSQKGAVDEPTLTRALSLIIAAISNPDVINDCGNDDLKDYLTLHLMDSLIQFLRESSVPVTITPLLNETLLLRLLQLLDDCRSCVSMPNSVPLTSRIFEALLEASLYSSDFWALLVSHLQGSSKLLQELLLEDPRGDVRKGVAKHIASKCGFTPSLALVSSMDFATAFWPILTALIPEAMKFPRQCQDIFGLCNTLFKKLGESSIDFFNLKDIVQQWGNLLLSYRCEECVGQVDSIDMVAQGLSNLLYCAASFAKLSSQDLGCGAIGVEIFRKHLFPDCNLIYNSDTAKSMSPNIPLLNSLTRNIMSEAVFLLVKDDPEQYAAILECLESLVIYDDEIGEVPYNYDLGFVFERSKSIRSHTGYVGLRNLGNTCYLNSLLTQLFMNVTFRKFMLGATIADGGASQKLLDQTQTLFSHMQNTLTRYVDPSNLAESIRTYEETPIDVNIQMDVDEFYNLVFDRWESQILSPEAKREFRSIYGGQLVQQVKSKECPHISERLEPFSAIQCDIKGKTCLQESLQAYVDGEVMEGDNKYKCSTCDRHVDAVKRACLKDLPNDLIFHLKRFDFNLRTLQRSKINDHFQFPDKIDMRPYKVEHLMDPSVETPEDIFELVGVLVHAGTAESGHYYSFIRERPSNGAKENWVEFNDEIVSTWDPSLMEHACFGGLESRLDTGSLEFSKNYSAYMLFYQRSSVVAKQKQSLIDSKLPSPLRLPVPTAISNQIALENECLMRKYCLHDSSHISFVSKILANIRKLNQGRCSKSHSLEKRALWMAMNHLDQVVSRTKDLPDYVGFMLGIRQLCQSCAECSRDFVEWYHFHHEGFKQMLLKNPEGLVRTETAQAILAALIKVKSDAAYAYGLSESGIDESADEEPQVIIKIVDSLYSLFDIFHFNCRAWPEYFGLLASIANIGVLEATLLLDSGFLRKVLDIVNADALLPLTPQFSRMLNIVNKRLNTKPANYEAIIDLLYKLMGTCDASEEPIPDKKLRLSYGVVGSGVPFNHTEIQQITQHWTRSNCHIFTEKLLQINQNPIMTRQILIMLLNWPNEELDFYIYHTLHQSIRKSGSSFLASPFLRAASVYCAYSPSDNAPSLIKIISEVAYSIDTAEGRAFLHFFKDTMSLRSTAANSPFTPEQILEECLANVTVWGPGLLTHYDATVRTETEDFLNEQVFDPELRPELARSLGMACLEYLHRTYIHPRQSIIRATLSSIQSVIESAAAFYDGEDESKADEFHSLRSSAYVGIKKLTIEEADEEVSDWNASEDEYGSSEEPIGESIADLCDADVQI